LIDKVSAKKLKKMETEQLTIQFPPLDRGGDGGLIYGWKTTKGKEIFIKNSEHLELTYKEEEAKAFKNVQGIIKHYREMHAIPENYYETEKELVIKRRRRPWSTNTIT
jgi:hypothetical protein